MTFQTANVTQRRSLRFFSRGQRVSEPYARANSHLLPRETFKGQRDVLAAYDQQARLLKAAAHHTSEIRRLHRESTEAAEAHRHEIGKAQAAGKDTSPIKNKVPGLDAQIVEHQALLDRANGAAVRNGRELGQLIQAAAPRAFTEVDKQLETAAAKVRRTVTDLEDALKEWAAPWQVLRILTTAHLFGGAVSDYDPEGAVPQEATDALARILEVLANPDHLRADQAQLMQEREKNAEAEARNASEFDRARR